MALTKYRAKRCYKWAKYAINVTSLNLMRVFVVYYVWLPVDINCCLLFKLDIFLVALFCVLVTVS